MIKTLTIRKRSNPVHTRLSIWVNGALITAPYGICLRNDEVDSFIHRLNPDRVDDDTVEATIEQDMFG